LSPWGSEKKKKGGREAICFVQLEREERGLPGASPEKEGREKKKRSSGQEKGEREKGSLALLPICGLEPGKELAWPRLWCSGKKKIELSRKIPENAGKKKESLNG